MPEQQQDVEEVVREPATRISSRPAGPTAR